jgi:hypothetical protein
LQPFVNRHTLCSVFLSSFAVAALHSAVTFASFTHVGSEFVYVFTFLSGFLSLVPVLSSWLIWFPAGVLLYLTGDVRGSLVVFVSHIGTVALADPWILGAVPGGGHHTTGLSLALGVYTFGPIGVIAGPLLVALSLSLREIYAVYQLPSQEDATNAGLSLAVATPNPVHINHGTASIINAKAANAKAARLRTANNSNTNFNNNNNPNNNNPNNTQNASSINGAAPRTITFATPRGAHNNIARNQAASTHSPLLRRAVGRSVLDD